MAKAQAACEQSGQPARRFRNFSYRTLDSWSRERRVMGKAEYLPGKATPRFILTSPDSHRQSVSMLAHE
jgi:hypothetical protein